MWRRMWCISNGGGKAWFTFYEIASSRFITYNGCISAFSDITEIRNPQNY